MALRTDNPNHILIGLGGTGGRILKAFKKRLYKEFPEDQVRQSMKPAVEFLYIDSTRKDLMNDERNDYSWRVKGRDVTFTEQEFLNIKSEDASLSHILNSTSDYPGLKYVVKNGAAMQQTIGKIGDAAGQKRRAGRIMFAINCANYLNALSGLYQSLKSRTGIDTLHIHIFTGLAGGTGSGAVIDVVAQTRKKYPEAEIDVYAMVPEKDIPQGFQAGRYHQNGYAALSELSAMNVGRFLPTDVLTGDEHIILPRDCKKQFGLMLFSNVNNNGMVVDSRVELPNLVADALYLRMFLPANPATEEFFRAWSCENIDDFLIEYNERSKSGDLEKARTKAISTFGIKRIVYPEDRIQEHISYTISEKILSQMRYNNFKEEGIGYVDEPVRKDYSEYTKNEGNLKKWKLDERHLTLEERILDSDKKAPSFDDYWEETVHFYSYSEAKDNNSQPLMEIENHCSEQYLAQFRLKQGVEDYFKDKSEERPLREQSKFIVEAIEQELYTGWFQGKYSMADLIGICDAILEYIKKTAGNIENEVNHLDDLIKQDNEDKTANTIVYDDLGVFSHIAGKYHKTYSEHQLILKSLYLHKTQRVAKVFESKLLSRLRQDFEEFAAGLNEFVGVLSRSQENLVKSISDRTKKQADLNLMDTTIEVSEDVKMTSFEEKLAKDRSKMDTLASVLRQKLVKEQPFAHFGDLASKIGVNMVKDVADQYITPLIISYHDNDDEYRHDRIVGINVLQQLQKLFKDGTIGKDVTMFAKDVTNYSGVFLKLNNQELNRVLKNNPNPNQESHSMRRKSVLISLPKSEGDDTLKSFANELKTALRGSFSADSPEVGIDENSPRKNEITIVEVLSCFPVRGLECLPLYKKEYDNLVNHDNEAERKQNRILLHSEGDGSELPPLEGEGTGPKDAELLPYFFIAAASGLIVWDKDELENEGWCFVSKDEWGTEVSTLISSTFTDIHVSENLTSEIKEQLIDEVEALLKRTDIKQSEKKSYCERIVTIMKDHVAKECSSPKSEKYQQYGLAAKSAMKNFQ